MRDQHQAQLGDRGRGLGSAGPKADGGDVTPDELSAALGGLPTASVATPSDVNSYELPIKEAREQFEKAYFEYHLRESGGSVSKVAQLSGMERTHLYRKLRTLGIDVKNI